MSKTLPDALVNVIRTALISPCGKYRYILTRTWDASKQRLLFIMLNPSTADADVDDATIRKCMGFALRMGFGGITVVNLFAYRATKPSDLIRMGFPDGPWNEAALIEALWGHTDVVLAWGAISRRRPEAVAVAMRMIELSGIKTHVLRALKDGTPEHPLYVPYPTPA